MRLGRQQNGRATNGAGRMDYPFLEMHSVVPFFGHASVARKN
jgi:hypothetical protein